MAYAAVISLKQTIYRLQNSSHISVVSSSREILDFAYKQLISLQEVLKKSDDSNCSRKRLNPLEGKIMKTLHKLEDSLESHSEEASSPKLPFELDLKEVWQEISSFIEAAKKMEKGYNQELENPNNYSDDDDDDDLAAAVPSRSIDSGVTMVGLSDKFTDVKDHLRRIIRPDDFGFYSFFGLAGIGRSILARSVYDDIEPSFDCRAWVRIGSTYQLKQILLSIIADINQPHEFLFPELGEDELSEYLYSRLKGQRYIVALDDIRDTDILIQLRRSLPEQNNGSAVFLTTSLMEVAEFDESFFLYELPTLLDEHFIWGYIRSVFFEANESISPEFEEAGKKIAKNCRGLRLVLARVMTVLRKHNKTTELWSDLAAAEHDRFFVVHDELLEAIDAQKYMLPGDKQLLDFSILFDRVKDHLYPDRLFPKMGIMTIYGMAGIGKTTLMKKLFEDHSVLHRFDCCAWVNVGSKYKSQQILVDILAQIYPYIDRNTINEDEKLAADLCAQLSYKKCLIMLDDLWSQEPVQYLKKVLPNIKGELMVTTRLAKVAIFGPSDRAMKTRLLNKEESWDLLREKVLGEMFCSSQLEIAGKKIAENCEGLPLLIIAVADHLSKSKITLEYWKEVAENKIHGVMMDAQNEISKTLAPSYKSLPQHLKACFLYMGVFPQNYEISTSQLKKLWFVEGFLEPNPSQTVEDCASRYLKELVDENVVMVRQKSSDFKTNKSCGLHYVFWHLSCNEAIKSNFFHALNTYTNSSMGSIQSHRRLCIRNSILLGFKDVHDAMGSDSKSRSLLCMGPPHHYPVPLYFGSKFLRVLDALKICLYEFPIEVVELIHLRYLALTCNGKLPSSISKLWNLQFLIVRQHLSIESSRNSSYLPKEIWDMKELKHLQISGSKLPNPDSGALLPNLSSLLDASVHSCTKRVFKRIPNLKKLGIAIELAPNDNSNPFRCLNRISRLRKLESLKCVVVNPELMSEVVPPPTPLSMFPSGLKKLSLGGLGYPWEHMSIIGKLRNLEVLKVRCYAFQGPAWEIDSRSFNELKFLSIEDTDLVRWDFKMPTDILSLRRISINHCYNLEQLPCFLSVSVEKVEVVESHPLAEDWAKEMKEKNWETLKLKHLEIHIQSSWNDA